MVVMKRKEAGQWGRGEGCWRMPWCDGVGGSYGDEEEGVLARGLFGHALI